MRISGETGPIGFHGTVMDRDSLDIKKRLCGRAAETAHQSVCLSLAYTGSRRQGGTVVRVLVA